MTVRVLIADDHHVVRQGLVTLLSSTPGIEIAGQAATGEDVVHLVTTTTADVVLLDLDMPGAGGLATISQIKRLAPTLNILILTMHSDDVSLFTALRAGALGFLVKDASSEEVVRAVLATADGQAIFGAGVAPRIASHVVDPGALIHRPFPDLTEREHQILNHLAAGRTNEAISQILGLSGKTVRNYVSNIFAKLQVSSRSEAIVRAREAGIGDSR